MFPRLFGSLFAAAVLASPCVGETVTLQYTGHTPALGSSALRVDFHGNTPSYFDALSVGAFKWTVTAESGNTFSVGQSLYTFCIQESQSIHSSQTYTLGSLSGAPAGGSDAGVIDVLAAAQIQGLVSSFYHALDFTSSNPVNYQHNAISYSDAEVGAAMQLAIWEIEYDGGTGGQSFGAATNYFTSGQVRATGTSTSGNDALTLATAWLNAFTSDSTFSSIALLNAYKQDQLVGIPNPPGGGSIPPVPLPAALPAGMALLAALGVAHLRRNR